MNGEWSEMEKLVISKMTEHSHKLDKLHSDIGSIKVQIAILHDREDRELAAAKSMAVKWGTAIAAVISTIIGGLFSWFRAQ
jgi:hypothetical protein